MPNFGVAEMQGDVEMQGGAEIVTSNFSFSRSVFKGLVLQTRNNKGLFENRLKWVTCELQTN